MALWHRIRPAGVECITHQCKRWHSLFPGVARSSVADRADGLWRFRAQERPLIRPPSRPSPSFHYNHVRSFAAPIQARPKPGADAANGPRLNGEITAVYVRLVTDEGHGVVSRREALDRAKKLDLDLVEVQRTADPPVCKIMDFHKEKFKQEVKEKERAKSKSAVALRNGENKEVRFKGKTEVKDLKIKAETVTRLMERGYRVKCTALPSGKEDEDLGGLLSRILSLIEDVSVVESGPHVVDTKQAYVIVRHVKFATKKSAKKVSDVMNAVNKGVSKNAIPDTQDEEEWEPIECSSEVEDEALSGRDFEKDFDFDDKRGPAKNINSSKPLHQKLSASNEGLDSLKAKAELKKDQTDMKATIEPSVVQSNRYSKQRETKPSFNQGRVARQEMRNESRGRSQFDPNQRQSNPGNPSSPSSSYRISPETGGSGDRNKEGRATMGKPSDPSLPSQSFGIFSSPKSAASGAPKNAGEAIMTKPRNPTSPTPSYGIFSKTEHPGASDQRNSGDGTMGKPSNSNLPTPSYGIFSASRTSRGDQRSPGNDNRSVDECTSASTNNPSNLSRSGVEKPRQDSDMAKGRWGVFSRETSPLNQHRASDTELKVQR